MKNYQILYALTFVLFTFIYSSCKSSNETKTETDAIENETVSEATQSDYAILKSKTLDLVKVNEAEIEAFKAKLKTETATNKVKFQREIDSLQAKNVALTSTLNSYKEQGKAKLNTFKERLQKSIDDINKDIETYKVEHK